MNALLYIIFVLLYAIGAALMIYMDFTQNEIYTFIPLFFLPAFLFGWGALVEFMLFMIAWIFAAVLYYKRMLPLGDVLAVPFLVTTPHLVMGLEVFVLITLLYITITRKKEIPLAGLVGTAMLMSMV
ncbi:MAG: hypothetical protein ACP5GS_08575 [Nitrososphaeria archaeon]